ncbi:MAG: ABC transporter permease [Acidobacteriota bacterium]|nr:ABC transporter permease [Acidobacteriota bacterium]
MQLFARLRSLVQNVLGRPGAERELGAELESFLEMRADEKVAAGIAPQEARRLALLEMGGVDQVKEQVRDSRTGAWLDTFARDARSGLRLLVRNPGFTAAAVIALALGIGASAAIFTVVNAVLLRPLAYGHPDRLAVILHRGRNPVSPANYLDWRQMNDAFANMGAAESWAPNLADKSEARAEKVTAVRVAPQVLDLLEVPPLMGRLFLAGEDEPGREREIVLGYGIWQRRFGGDREVLGRSVRLNGDSYTVVGVMPRSFAFPPFWETGAELWAPLPLGPRKASRTGNSLRVVARLKPGVSLARASAQMAAITAGLEREHPGTNRDVTVRSMHETVVRGVRPALLVLLGAVAFVLVIACANVAHMLLARASARKKEIAVRTALGASRSRVVRQLLTESVVLASLGGAGGWLLAWAGVRALVRLAPEIPRLDTISLDGRVLAFTLAVSVITGVAFGLVPALQVSRRELTDALREGERGSTEGGGRSRLRSILVGSELSLALVLTVGAGLMIRSFLALTSIDPGFDARNVLTMVVSVAGTSQADPGRRAEFYTAALEKAAAIRGVESVSATNHIPLAGDIWGFPFQIEGRPEPKPGDTPTATFRAAFPGYFRTMKIAIARGREFTAADRLGAPDVVIVNQRFVDLHWRGEDPVGKRLTVDNPGKAPLWRAVVGVAGNAVRNDWTSDPEEEVYIPYLQSRMYMEGPNWPLQYATLAVRTDGDPARFAAPIRDAIASIDRNVSVSEVATMEDVVARSNSRPRFYLLLLGSFAAVAVLLAALGIYGVMSYSVSRRFHEIGIRMALGAERGDLVRLVVGEGMRVAAIGTLVGLAGAFAVTRLMSSLLYGVRATDPATFAGVALLLAGVALAASWIPARRATRVDPLTALRHD